MSSAAAAAQLFCTPRPAVASLPHLITALDAELIGKVVHLTKGKPGLWPLSAPFDENDVYDRARESAPFRAWALPANQAEVLSFGLLTQESVFGMKLLMLDASMDEATLRRLATPTGERMETGAYVMGGFQDLVAAGSTELQEVGDLVGGEGDALQTEVNLMTGDIELALIQCFRTDEGSEAQLGVYAAEMNGVAGYRDTLEQLLFSWTVKFEDDQPFRGGTLVKYCVTAKDTESGASPFCETDWITDDLQVGAFLYGDARSTVLMTDWLTAILPDVVDNLSGDDFEKIEAGAPY